VKSLIQCDPLHTSRKDLRADINTLVFRTEHEGLSFLTKTLPKLGKALDQGLMSGSFNLPREFHHSHELASIPAFMQEYFKLLFNELGELLDSASPDAVKHLRQVLYFAYKLETPYSVEDEERVISNFIQTEQELEFGSDHRTSQVIENAARITARIFEDFDPKDISPRHGPGAVATGERLDAKWDFSRLYRDIHQVFPYYDYFIVGKGRELLDRLEWYKSLTRLDHGQAKVVLVPKDSRGPRLISCEPLEFQWIQQGLGRKLMSHLERNYFTKGQINFTFQKVNQRLAIEGSLLSGSWSTIDLKEASDRVSLELVRAVFKDCPGILRALEACRTTETKLPDGRILSLKKYAPMGSALCFPVESYIFWVLMVSSEVSGGYKPSDSPYWSSIKRVGEKIYVYGDDIIIREDMALRCIHHLERFALKVNVSKCCITGPFKESCGIDAFKGTVVTPLRLRKLWSGRVSDGTAYVAYVSLANALLQKGYKDTSDMIWEYLERVYGAIPYGTQNSSFPCRVISDPDEAERFNHARFRSRWNSRYQRLEFLVSNVLPKRKKSILNGWLRLTRDILMPQFGDPTDIVVPRSIRIKRGWAAV